MSSAAKLIVACILVAIGIYAFVTSSEHSTNQGGQTAKVDSEEVAAFKDDVKTLLSFDTHPKQPRYDPSYVPRTELGRRYKSIIQTRLKEQKDYEEAMGTVEPERHLSLDGLGTKAGRESVMRDVRVIRNALDQDLKSLEHFLAGYQAIAEKVGARNVDVVPLRKIALREDKAYRDYVEALEQLIRYCEVKEVGTDGKRLLFDSPQQARQSDRLESAVLDAGEELRRVMLAPASDEERAIYRLSLDILT